MRKPNRQTLFLGTVTVASTLVITYLTLFYNNGNADAPNPVTPTATKKTNPISPRRAYQWLEKICELGPRPSGSAAMASQQQMLTEHFKKLGGTTFLQTFDHPHPQKKDTIVPLANLVVHWHPDRTERILLCAHYDTRPFPVRDPKRPKGIFVGANDGASGTAVLAELAHFMSEIPPPYGVDFVLFDAEEFVFQERRDPFFLGSEYFSKQYLRNPPTHRYRCAVLLDMVGDRELQIYPEQNSLKSIATRQLVRDIWSTAQQLGVKEFIDRRGHEIQDDHIKLMEIARIPACDIIDFDYPRPGRKFSKLYWHTEADTPDKCSGESLAKVGWVVLEWLRRLR